MGSFRFPKSDRLLKRSDFLRISRNGKRVQNRYFIAVFTPGPSKGNRLGITVTKRVGNAVTRNRIKRQVREFFRHDGRRLVENSDINIIAKKEAAGISSAEAARSMKTLFERIRG